MLEETLRSISPVDYSIANVIQERLDNLTKPLGALGRLEEIAKRYCLIKGDVKADIGRKVVFTFAADHGVTLEGVSKYPKEVTAQMVFNFLRGGAGINVLARHVGAEVVVVDIGVDYDFGNPPIPPLAKGGKGGLFVSKKIARGTGNMVKGPAMTKDEAVKAIEVGIELVRKEKKKKRGLAVVGTGEMGIGNTTASSAIAAVITGSDVEEVTGRGTGIDDDTYQRKVDVIKKAIEVNKPDREDGLDVLSKVGGYEIGGIAGVILGAASEGIPVVVDGFISSAGALIAASIEPKVKDYIFASHMSQEIGHRAILESIGQRPILDLDMRLGEGTGAALAMGIIDASVKILNEMATFDEAGVSN